MLPCSKRLLFARIQIDTWWLTISLTIENIPNFGFRREQGVFMVEPTGEPIIRRMGSTRSSISWTDPVETLGIRTSPVSRLRSQRMWRHVLAKTWTSSCRTHRNNGFSIPQTAISRFCQVSLRKPCQTVHANTQSSLKSYWITSKDKRSRISPLEPARAPQESKIILRSPNLHAREQKRNLSYLR